MSDNTFENNNLDLRVEGSRSGTDEPGGDNNEAKVVIHEADPTILTIDTFDCFPEENWTNNSTDCTSEAKVKFDSDENGND